MKLCYSKIYLCYKMIKKFLTSLTDTSSRSPKVFHVWAWQFRIITSLLCFFMQLMISKKSSSSPMINLIDRTNCLEKSTNKASWSSSGTQTLGRRRSSSSRGVRFNQTPPGLFTLLHKATSCPWSDDRTFVHRLFGQWGGGKGI